MLYTVYIYIYILVLASVGGDTAAHTHKHTLEILRTELNATCHTATQVTIFQRVQEQVQRNLKYGTVSNSKMTCDLREASSFQVQNSKANSVTAVRERMQWLVILSHLVLVRYGTKEEVKSDHLLAGTCNLRPDCISQQA